MRISDWSSDVCSSDLFGAQRFYLKEDRGRRHDATSGDRGIDPPPELKRQTFDALEQQEQQSLQSEIGVVLARVGQIWGCQRADGVDVALGQQLDRCKEQIGRGWSRERVGQEV